MPWSHGNGWIFSGLVDGVGYFEKNRKLMFYDVCVDIGKLKAMAAMSFCWGGRMMEGKEYFFVKGTTDLQDF